MSGVRKIIHIDMDAFYASIEQRDDPALRGRPLAVGYPGERGVVAAASYEARAFGVRSALSSRAALARCPQLVFVPARFDVYEAISLQIRRILLDYTDRVEPLSLDEAYLDVTENRPGIPFATRIAREIKRRILKETHLTASAGVSVNKFLAKIASDYRKPDGLFVVLPHQAETFVEGLKIERFWGVGRVTAAEMHRLGIHTGADLKKYEEHELVRLFGKIGSTYYRNARALDDREVEPDRVRKSVGAENTFAADIDDGDELRARLRDAAVEAWDHAGRIGFVGRTVTVKAKYADFERITRSRTLPRPVRDFAALWEIACGLLDAVDVSQKKIRLLGLVLSNREPPDRSTSSQLEFDFGED